MKKVKLVWLGMMTIVTSGLLGGAGGSLWMRGENNVLAVLLLAGMVVVCVAGVFAYVRVKNSDETKA